MDATDDVTVLISDGVGATEKIELLAGLRGASLRRLSATKASQEFDVILGYTHREDKMGGQGDVLIPFPGRVAGGTYSFGGHDYQMAKNDHDGPNAIHGFLREVDWTEALSTQTEVVFTRALPENSTEGYPFGLLSTVTYRVEDFGMTCSYEITNTGSLAAPVAAGFHPYFTAGDEWVDESELTLPMSSMLEFDDHLIPTGRVLPIGETSFDFRKTKTIGDKKLNHCFCDPIRDEDGRVNIKLSSKLTGRTITVWLDESIDYVVLYSGDPMSSKMRRRGLAIEPMTCGSDAFNHQDWGLVTLNPGESYKGQWGVNIHTS